MKVSFARNGPRRWPIYFYMGSRKSRAIRSGIGAMLLAIGLYGSLMAQTSHSLEEAIRLSGDHSYGVKAAQSDSLSALYDLGASRALRYPTASLNATSFYINKLQSINLPVTSLTLGVHDNYQADLKLTLPIWTGGRIGGQIDIQSALFEARGAGLEAARQSNAYNTRKAYLNLLAAQGLAKAADASLSRVRLIGEDTGNLYESGLADSVNLLEADLALERALQTQDERSTAVQNAKAFLARLVGLAPDTIGVIDSVPTPDISMYLNLPPQRESIGRAELRAQDSRVKAANFAISLSRANYYPTLNGFGGYSYGKPNKDMFQNKWNDYWTAGLNLNWDFNLGNRTGKNISSAKQAANSALAAREDLEEALYLQASTAYDNLLLSFRSYQISGRQFEIAKKQYALGQQKQQAGSLALNRLLELEADLSSSEQLYQVSTINFYISETEYLYAIGSPRIYGGFQR